MRKMVHNASSALAAVGLAATLAIGSVSLASCSTKNADVNCTSDACTVTFARTGDSEVNILGIKVHLVSVQNNQAVVEVGTEQVTIPVGEKVKVLNGTFDVEVQQLTSSQVVVRVSRASSG